ncbi:MAG: ATP-dependent DNA helicase RecG [bacterium]|nr:ATP-dependent DNA helicase RecG [bacterium]
MTKSQSLDIPIQYLKGIGPKKAKVFSKLGLKTIEDLLYYFPRTYQDRTQIKPIFNIKTGEKETICGIVLRHLKSAFPRKRIKINKVIIGDGTGVVSLLFFNQPSIEESLPVERKIIAYGMIRKYRQEYQMSNFEYEIFDKEEDFIHNKRIVPIYHLMARLPSNWQRVIRKTIKSVCDLYLDRIKETLPKYILKKYSLLDIIETLQNIHFPKNWTIYKEAKKRLIFEEFFYLQLALGYIRHRIKKEEFGIKYSINGDMLTSLYKIFPFPLTNAQIKSIEEISQDMQSSFPMCRLIHGDVGSGKTVVAIIAFLIAAYNKYQVAFMVPTEILAEQHYLNIKKLLADRNIRIALLTSSKKGKIRKEILQNLAIGKIDIIIGTHSLIQKDVVYNKLGLCIIDEQHRFGVMQRLTLQKKSQSEKKPDILVMSATPIPRTLALTLYGDLDISTISELPPNRKEIMNFCRSEKDLPNIYDFIKKEIQEGRQAYIVYPLVDESKEINLKSATKMVEKLQKEVFKNCHLGLLHGKMKVSEKDEIMTKFKNKKIDILISTTVIEVGIDVPNATIMIIEHAERFGLSQLHQLRGRIGRGEYKSYCIFIANPQMAKAVNSSSFIKEEYDENLIDTIKRLRTIVSTCDGFKIAEADFEIRGPGEFFGEKQHGLPKLKLSNFIRDVEWLKTSRKEVDEIFKDDPLLKKDKNQELFNNFKNNYLPYLEKDLLLE